MPVLTNETIKSAEKFNAVVKYFCTMAPYHQVVGMIYSVIDPPTYKEGCKLVKHWCKVGAMSPIIHTERQAWGLTVLLKNRAVKGHIDKGDYVDLWTATAVSGDYGGERDAGDTFIPIYQQGYHSDKHSITMFKAAKITHAVKRYPKGSASVNGPGHSRKYEES